MIVFTFAVPKHCSNRPAVETDIFALCTVAAAETPARLLQ